MFDEDLTDEEIVVRELSGAVSCMSYCIPFLEKMKGEYSQEILDLLDEINKLSVMY